MSLKDEFAVWILAVTNGCHPAWVDGSAGWAYYCTCPDNRHGTDTQCSMITMETAARPTPNTGKEHHGTT